MQRPASRRADSAINFALERTADNRSVKVSCACKQSSRTHPGNVARISVRDEGLGLVPDFEVTKGNGFGMRLVNALAKQTHGQFRIERHPRGTEFILDIPIDVAAPLTSP